MIAEVQDYVRARMRELGYTEWTDGFNFENIPRTRLDTTFHIALGASAGVSNNQDHQIINSPFTVRIFGAQTRTPKDLIDAAVVRADAVIAKMINPRKRLVEISIKNVVFNLMEVEQLDESNDNGVIVRVEFTASVFLSTR